MAKGVLRDDHGKKDGMTAGRQDRFRDAGSDPYNKAGKADGRDASSGFKGKGTLKTTPRTDVAAKGKK